MTGPGARLLLGISVLWVPLAFVFDGVTVLLLPLRLGGDAGQLGLVSFLGLAVAAGLQPAAGLLADRWRDRIGRRAFLAGAGVPVLVGLWLLAWPAGLAAAIVGYVVLQVGATAVQAAQQTLIPEHVGEPERGRAAGFKAAFDVGGAFLAFLVLGVLLAAGGTAVAAVAIALLLLGGIALVFILVPRERRALARPDAPLRLPVGLPAVIASRFLFLFATYGVGRFLVLLVAERMGIAPERAVDETGGVLALLTLATALSAIPFGWLTDHRSTRQLMGLGALSTAAGIVVLLPSAGLGGVIAGGLLMSLGSAAFMTGNWAATTLLVPAPQAGGLMAIANLGTGLAAAAAGLLGPLIDAGGFVPALLVAATASVAAVLPIAAPIRRQLVPEDTT